MIDVYSIDIDSLLGTNKTYVGFTCSTGAGRQNEDILHWTLVNTATLPPTAVPEPGSLGMFGLGPAGLLAGVFVRRKQREQRAELKLLQLCRTEAVVTSGQYARSEQLAQATTQVFDSPILR